MGLAQLPDELLLTLGAQWPCREPQRRQLSVLLCPTLPSPATLVVYGPQATGKSSIVQAHLEAHPLQHVIVRCRECVTARQLLEHTVAAVHRATQDDVMEDHDQGAPVRCETVSALVVHLQRRLESCTKFALVFDGVDKQREAPPTLLPALARLGEMIPSLVTVLIVQHPPARFLQQTGVPHLHFPPYTRNQSINILSRNPPDIFLEQSRDETYDDNVHAEDKAWLWPRFCAAVWDSLGQFAARDLSAFRDVCDKLWRPFVAPIVNGDFGTRDFSRLLVSQRRLFQDETVLRDFLVSQQPAPTLTPKPHARDLPYYAKWLLIAAYLASFNPPKTDALYFMKSTERKRRKKGGGTARSGGGRPSQNRKILRHLLAPATFTLDRLLSILHAILPHDFRSTVDVYTQIATLTSLRLLVRGGGVGSGDPLEAGGKWKVGPAMSWEYVQALARGLDFGLIDYVVE